MDGRRSPLRSGYLVQRPLANRCLRAIDWLLERCCHATSAGNLQAPRRLLLCNGAHLGDVLLSTALFTPLKRKYPGLRLGLLVGSWSRPVVADHPEIDRIHIFDHWKLNRSPVGLAARVRRHFATRSKAIAEIRSEGYDTAIDLYYYFPNSIPLLWRAGVPVRIGYSSGGFGPLLTQRLDWTNQSRHVLDFQADLFRRLPGFAEADWTDLRPVPRMASAKETARLLRKLNIGSKRYTVLHPGAGNAVKAWPRAHWRALAEALVARGEYLVFTGSASERGCAASIISGLRSARNLCGRLNWRQFSAIVGKARALIGVDSVAGHLAAAFDTPYVIISTGINDPAHWSPRGRSGTVLTQPVNCSPCYQARGCASMTCVRTVEVAAVLEALGNVSRVRDAG